MEQKIMIQDAMAFAGYCYAIVDTQTGTISFKKKKTDMRQEHHL